MSKVTWLMIKQWDKWTESTPVTWTGNLVIWSPHHITDRVWSNDSTPGLKSVSAANQINMLSYSSNWVHTIVLAPSDQNDHTSTTHHCIQYPDSKKKTRKVTLLLRNCLVSRTDNSNAENIREFLHSPLLYGTMNHMEWDLLSEHDKCMMMHLDAPLIAYPSSQ